MSSPESPNRIPRHRPAIVASRSDALPVPTRSGALASLIRNRSHSSLSPSVSSHHRPDDEEAAPNSHDDDGDSAFGRLLISERRLGRILKRQQSRSMNLIGKSNPRYRWDQYWKHEAELKHMKKPLREYYKRTNELIQQYMYIDLLLDSAIPHDLLNEYSEELEASAFRPVSVPETIVEDPSATTSSSSSTPEDTPAAYDTLSPAGRGAAQLKRSPKDIFRSSEEMPLLAARDGDEEEDQEGYFSPPGQTEPASHGTDTPGPKPYSPWLDDAQVESDSPIVSLAIWVNMIANAVLLAGKVVVVFSVPSMSVIASLVDAVLDLLSTAIVWTTTRLISSSQKDQFRYPVGRGRLEPLGVLVFSIIMITSFFQVGLESIQRLASPDHEILELGIPAIAIMASTVVIKGAVWVWCRLVKNSSVRALADDAKTDVIFNIGSILFPIVGFYGRIWWLDALGGLILSLVVVLNWGQTSAHHVRNLTGFSASPDERNLLLYLTMRFATSIRQIQNLRAYHAGDKLFVEVDIVLSANTPLKDSHDLSEVLTYFLESVPIVDRAFVHVDYLSYHAPTHMLKQSRS